MAVDLNFSNSVIDAYMKGSSMRRQKVQDAQKDYEYEEQRKDRQKQDSDRLDEQKREFDANQTLSKAANDINVLKAKSDIQTNTANTGLTPPGFEKSTDSMVDNVMKGWVPPINDPGRLPGNVPPTPPDQTITYNNPQNGMSFEVPSQHAYFAQQAANKMAMIEPEIKRDEAKQTAEAQRQAELERIKLNGQLYNTDLTNSSREKVASGNNQTAIDVANINAQSRINAAKSRGVNDKTVQQSIGMMNKFNSSDIAKRYGKLQEAVSFAKSLPEDTTKPMDDYSLIVNAAKALDPDTGVREGETANVEKHAQSLASTYGFNIKNLYTSTSFLTPQARQAIKTDILRKAQSSQKEYQLYRKENEKSFSNIGQKLEDWVPNLGSADIDEDKPKPSEPLKMIPSHTPAGPPTNPKKGDTRTYPNGNVGVWDGQGWVKQ